MTEARDIEKMCSYATLRTGKQERLRDSTCLCENDDFDRVYCVGIDFFSTGHTTMDVSYHLDRVEDCPYSSLKSHLRNEERNNFLIDCLD